MKKIDLDLNQKKYLETLLAKHRHFIDFQALKSQRLKVNNDYQIKLDNINDDLKNKRITKKKATAQKNKIRNEKKLKQQKISKELIKNYTEFANSDDVYAFTNAIPVRCCPYCNLHSIPTVKGADRPDIDHFEAKALVPEKQLELENMVPCCLKCNRDIKNEKCFSLDTHINPYIEDFDSLVEFYINPHSSDYTKEENFDICIKRNSSCKDRLLYEKAMNNVRDFKLIERYQAYKKDVTSIFENEKFYFEKKQKELVNLAQEKKSLRETLFPDEKCNINKTERGKLKIDIIKRYIKDD